MTSPRRQGDHPRTFISALAFCEDVASIGEVVEADEDLRDLTLLLTTELDDFPLVGKDFPKDMLVNILNKRRLLALVGAMIRPSGQRCAGELEGANILDDPASAPSFTTHSTPC